MLRFLKYIFLIFGGLALAIMIFFFSNNKNDVMTALEYRRPLSYSGLQESCPEVEKKYFSPCFIERFEEYVSKVGLTGVSIGLKLAFNALEEDKENTTYFENSKIKDINYALNFLVINNLAIDNAYRRFYGFEFTYGGYVLKLQDFYKKAYEFSDNIIEGLESAEGLAALAKSDKESDKEQAHQLRERLNKILLNYKEVSRKAKEFMKVEVDKQEKKFQEYQNS